MLVGDEEMIDLLACSENSHISEISLMEIQTNSTSALAYELEHIVKQINYIIQNDFTEIKSNFAEADEKIESLLQSQIELNARIANELVPKSELLMTQKEMDGCQELIRTLRQHQMCNEKIAQVSDREIARCRADIVK